jgi:hypothetical protein
MPLQIVLKKEKVLKKRKICRSDYEDLLVKHLTIHIFAGS